VPYLPKPLETAHVALPPQLLDLTELLAKNAHETWARLRLSEGWRFGVSRDDRRKEHPCLVPYEDLPDSEKQYDRNAALETLKAVVALGYEITKRSPDAE